MANLNSFEDLFFFFKGNRADELNAQRGIDPDANVNYYTKKLARLKESHGEDHPLTVRTKADLERATKERNANRGKIIN